MTDCPQQFDAPQERIPPQDIEAEVCVLGSMMLDWTCVAKVRMITKWEDFFRPAHQIIFRAICKLVDKNGEAFDIVLLKNALEKTKQLAAVGGIEYLVHLAEGVPTASNAEYYAAIVRDKAKLRELIIAGENMVREGFIGGEDADAVAGRAAQVVASIAQPLSVRGEHPADEVSKAIEDAISGARASIPWIWPDVTRWARPCAPANVVILCGDPGTGKSLLLQEQMITWHLTSIHVAMLHLEKDREHHLTRALAQIDGNSELTSTDWIKANADDARQADKTHKDKLDSYGNRVWNMRGPTTDLVYQWIESRANEGARIIGVDPISGTDSGDKVWVGDKVFINRSLALAAAKGCSLIFVTHPREIGGKPSLDNVRGGRAITMFSDCVLWLIRHKPPKTSDVRYPCGVSSCEHNRSLVLLKTRNGAGDGVSVALGFEAQTLRTCEYGLIAPKQKKSKQEDD